MGRYSPTVLPTSSDPLAEALDQLSGGFRQSFNAAHDRRRQRDRDERLAFLAELEDYDRGVRPGSAIDAQDRDRGITLDDLAAGGPPAPHVTPAAPRDRTAGAMGIDIEELASIMDDVGAMGGRTAPTPPAPKPGAYVPGMGFAGISKPRTRVQPGQPYSAAAEERFVELPPDGTGQPRHLDTEQTPEARATRTRAQEQSAATQRRREELDYELGARERATVARADADRERQVKAYVAAGMPEARARAAVEDRTLADEFFKPAPGEHVVDTPDGIMLVNTRTGTARPVTTATAGQPVKGHPRVDPAARAADVDNDRRDAAILRRAQELTKPSGPRGRTPGKPWEEALAQATKEVDAVMGSSRSGDTRARVDTIMNKYKLEP